MLDPAAITEDPAAITEDHQAKVLWVSLQILWVYPVSKLARHKHAAKDSRYPPDEQGIRPTLLEVYSSLIFVRTI